MIEQLINNYGDFGDALVVNVEYKTNVDLSNNSFKDGTKEVIVIISCFNLLKEFEREIIKIQLTEVEEFRHIKYDRMIMDTFVEKENDSFVIDFDPIITTDKSGEWITKKNLNSGLSIKFKKLHYEIIE
jgi:hypothetical protein